MTLYAIMVASEASEPFLHLRAYKTLGEAQNAIQDEFGASEAKNDFVYKDKDYTYYYIERLEVTL